MVSSTLRAGEIRREAQIRISFDEIVGGIPHAGAVGAAAVMPPDGSKMHLFVAVDEPSTTAVTILCELRSRIDHYKIPECSTYLIIAVTANGKVDASPPLR